MAISHLRSASEIPGEASASVLARKSRDQQNISSARRTRSEALMAPMHSRYLSATRLMSPSVYRARLTAESGSRHLETGVQEVTSGTENPRLDGRRGLVDHLKVAKVSHHEARDRTRNRLAPGSSPGGSTSASSPQSITCIAAMKALLPDHRILALLVTVPLLFEIPRRKILSVSGGPRNPRVGSA